MRRDGPGLPPTLRDALLTGAAVGAWAGVLDGLVRTLGLEPGLFLLRVQEQGLRTALTHGLPAPGALPGLLGCTAAAGLVYALIAAGAATVGGLALHPWLRRAPERRRARLLALGLAAWLFLELLWWTRPLILPGRPAAGPARLAVSVGLALLAIALGAGLARLVRRPRCRRWLASPLLLGALLLAGGAALALDAGADEERGRVHARNADLPNVLFVVVDALRADALGAMPVLDRLAEDGVLFEHALAQAPHTWSSFGSLITGKVPSRHGLLEMAAGRALPENLTLPELLDGSRRRDGGALADGDYLTVAMLTGALTHGSGLDRGFDHVHEAMLGHDMVDRHRRWPVFRAGLLPWLYASALRRSVDDGGVAERAVEWLRRHGARRWAMLLHLYAPHTPYDPPQALRREHCDASYRGPFQVFDHLHRRAIEAGELVPDDADRRQIRGLYRASAAQADSLLGRVVAELQRQGRLDDTLVVVTADHGESLGEGGRWEHGRLHGEVLRVPLVLRWPRALPRGARVAARVDAIDVTPTILDLVGLVPPPHASGLAPDASSEERAAALDGESLVELAHGRRAEQRAHSLAEDEHHASIQDDRHRLLVPRDGGPARLYDLRADPLEVRDLLADGDAQHAQTAARLARALGAWRATLPESRAAPRPSARTVAEQAALLEALGYGAGADDQGDG